MDGVQRFARQRAAGRERVFLRPQHQRQRRAELVADVGEERRLGAIQLGQRLGALAFGLVSARVADRGDDLRGRQLEERAVSGVQAAVRADAADQHAVRLRLVGRRERQRDRLARRLRPSPVWQRAEAFDDAVEHDRRSRVERGTDGPRQRRRIGVEVEVGGGQLGVAVLEADAAGEPRGAARVVEQVGQRKRDVRLVLVEHRGRLVARLLSRLGLGGARAQLAQRAELPFAVNLFGGLGHGGEHAADAGPLDGVVRDGAVRDDEVRLLQEPPPVDQHVQIVAPRRRLAAVRRLDHRADDVPDLRPAFGGGLAHRARMLVAQHGPVGVVVDLDELRSPPQQHGEPVVQQQADHGPQRLRPALDGPERRRRPVDGAHQGGHLAATSKQITRVGGLPSAQGHPRPAQNRRVLTDFMEGPRG